MRPQDERYIDQLEQIKAKLQAENEALKQQHEQDVKIAGELFDKNVELEKELAELKARRCEGCKLLQYGCLRKVMTGKTTTWKESVDYCSLWEKRQ